MSVTQPIKILAINASERKDGNNTVILDYARRLLAMRGAELEVVRLWELTMTPCGPCGDCNFRTTPCEVRDDVAGVVERMVAADGIIYATPIHGYSAAPLMPAFIERSGTGYLRFDRRLTNKVAGVIVTGRRYGHVETFSNLVLNALLNRMIVAGFGFPSVAFGNQVGEVLEDEEGMEMITRMLNRMVDLITVLREHRELTGHDALAVEVPNERARA
ncbi:flavodoxin family protein [Microbispora sp. RL4-1S]|uniref:Flavodoxin family protein n=1 Tax=Microbispora oryzae TaxID=2806554 RepID=A0A941AGQ1_9ACTN|nr:flavodoxin family protein [Microbispora oryzae]MBP2703226.1 flavodoxin family protein [Microbispora oryzae]